MFGRKNKVEKSERSTSDSAKKPQNGKKTRKEKKQEIERLKSVQNAFGYNQMLRNGICCMDDNLYSVSVRFSDVNFSMAPEEGKITIFQRYMEILNSLSTDKEDVSLTINNRDIDTEDFKKRMLIPLANDGLDDLRLELNQQRTDDLDAGHNKISSEKMMTITVKADNIQEAKRELDKAVYDLENSFSPLGSECELMSGKDRLDTIHSVVRPGKSFTFDYSKLGPFDSTKDFICPYSMDFGASRSYFTMDDRYCQVLYLAEWATEVTEAFFEDLISLENNLMITLHMSMVPRGEDISHIQFQIDDMRAQRSKIIRRDRKQGGDGDVPDQLEFEYQQALQLLEDVQQRNQRLFHVQMLVMINAGSKEEMDYVRKDIQSAASKRGFEFLPMDFEQPEAFNAVLPLGRPKEKLGRTTVSKVCSVMIPFTSKEIRATESPIYYGTNPISRNMILANRRELANPSGWILGKPGFGKSWSAKEESMAVLLQDPNADIFFIDPQGEYTHLVTELNKISRKEQFTVLKVDTHSNLHFNPFEVDLSDPEWKKRKAEFLLFVIAEMIGSGELMPQQKSLVDQIVAQVYHEYELAHEMDPGVRQPTLKDFYRKLQEYGKKEQNAIALDMAASLWIYVNGSIDLFAQESNVDMNSRFIVFDISEVGDSIRTLAMKVILETLEQRVRVNHLLNKPTYVYIDEIYLLLKDRYSEVFLNEFWKWCRKFGGVATGITQNVSELLESAQAASMLSNSEFCIMLAQGQEDLARLQNLFDLSEEQARSLITAGKGSGLIKYGSTIIPFKNSFPKDTKLYEIWNTDPREKVRIEQAKMLSQTRIGQPAADIESESQNGPLAAQTKISGLNPAFSAIGKTDVALSSGKTEVPSKDSFTEFKELQPLKDPKDPEELTAPAETYVPYYKQTAPLEGPVFDPDEY